MSKTLVKKLNLLEVELWKLGYELEKRLDDGKYKDNPWTPELARQEIARSIGDLIVAQKYLANDPEYKGSDPNA